MLIQYQAGINPATTVSIQSQALIILSAKAQICHSPNVSIGEACRNDIVLAEMMTKA